MFLTCRYGDRVFHISTPSPCLSLSLFLFFVLSYARCYFMGLKPFIHNNIWLTRVIEWIMRKNFLASYIKRPILLHWIREKIVFHIEEWFLRRRRRKIDRRIYNLKWIHIFFSLFATLYSSLCNHSIGLTTKLSIKLVGIFAVERISVRQFWSVLIKIIQTNCNNSHFKQKPPFKRATDGTVARGINKKKLCVCVSIESNSIALRIHYQIISLNSILLDLISRCPHDMCEGHFFESFLDRDAFSYSHWVWIFFNFSFPFK